MRSIRSTLLAPFACVALAALIGAAAAQEDAASFPSKPIRLVVGFGAGGGNDLVARIVGPKLSELLGQPVVIENRPGAAGQLAVVYAQSQPADGYTLVVGAIGQLAVAQVITPNLPFHPTRTLVPLTLLGSYWLAIAGSTQHGINTLKDLVAFAKANPDKSNYPSSSPAFTIPAELFKLKTGMPGQLIPYKSTNEMMLSIAGGQTLFGFSDPPIVIPLAQGGKLRALAMTGTEPPARAARCTDGRRSGLWKYRHPAAVDRRICNRGHAAGDRPQARDGAAPGTGRPRRARQAQWRGLSARRPLRRGLPSVDRG